jgi:hypothetical protein
VRDHALPQDWSTIRSAPSTAIGPR